MRATTGQVTPEQVDAADDDHQPVSLHGDVCDICGLPVTVPTDEHGRPIPGDVDARASQHTWTGYETTAAATRRCDSCGGALPARTHRQRDDQGRLVCDSCKTNPQPSWSTSGHRSAAGPWPYMPGVPAAGHVTSSGYWHPGPIDTCTKGNCNQEQREDKDARERRERGRRSSRQRPDYPYGGGRHTAGIMDYYDVVVLHQGDEAPLAVASSQFLDVALTTAARLWDENDSLRNVLWRPYVSVQVVNRGNGSVFWANGANTTDGRFTSMKRQAHDSGDGGVIYHCPFCGAGSVTGGSDGTVSCGYCHTNFTVQIQPAHPNMPQTVNGQPFNAPGMPAGQQTDVSTPIDPAHDPEETPSTPTDPSQPPEEPEPEEESSGGGSQPPWLRNSGASRIAVRPDPSLDIPDHLLTHAGDVLDAARYRKHLALLHADDKREVLDQVRGEDGR